MTRKHDAEAQFAIHLTELGVDYVPQYHYAPGRKLRADFALLSPHRILIEIQGGIYQGKRTRKDGTEYRARGAHGSVGGILADIERLNVATMHHWRVLRFTPDQVNSLEAKEFVAMVVAGR